MAAAPNKSPDDEVCNKEAAMRCVPCEILCCEKHVTLHKEKGHKLVKPREPESEIVFATNINHIQVDQRDESASLQEQDTNSTAGNAELGNLDQVQVESLTASLEKMVINRQRAERDSTSPRPVGAVAIPVDDVKLEPGSNTNSEKVLDHLNKEHVKKTAYTLCELAFTRDELSSKTLTGRGKGTKADEGRKLDEKRVSTVVDTVQNIHPVPKEQKEEEKKVIRKHIAAKLHICQQSEKRKTSRKNEGNDKQK